MVAHDDLHSLIHSLNRAEKKYFRQYAKSNATGDSAYLKLFDALEKQSEPNEKLLHKKFPKNYAFTRHYLYQLLLRSLSDFHSHESTQTQMYVLYNEMAMLYKKSQFNACQRHLVKLRKLAEEKEEFTLLLRLVGWQRRLNVFSEFRQAGLPEIEVLEAASERLVRTQQELEELLAISHRLIHFMRVKGTPATRSTHGLYEKVLARLEEIKPEKLLSVRALLEYHHNCGSAWFGKRNFEKTLHHIVQEIEIILAHPKLFADEENVLSSRFNNMLAICVDLSRWDLFDEYLQKLEIFGNTDAVKQNHTFHFAIRERVAAFRLRKAVDTGNTNQLAEIETNATELFCEALLTPGFRLTLSLYLSMLHLMAGDNDAAYRWLRVMQYETDQNLRVDLHAYARIIELLLVADSGDATHFESVLRSAKRQLQVVDQLNIGEKQLLQLLGKFPFDTTAKIRLAYFQDFGRALVQMKKDGIHTSPAVDKMMQVWVMLHLPAKA